MGAANKNSGSFREGGINEFGARLRPTGHSTGGVAVLKGVACF